MGKLRRGLGWTLAIVLVIAVFLRLFILEVWTAPESDLFLGSSMAPTLAAGDAVVVLRRGTPGFGELVRCADPQDPKAFVVGRIGGVEGDTVEIEGHRLTVNGREYKSESACHQSKIFVKHPETLKEVELRCEVVTMGPGWHYRADGLSAFQEQKKTVKVGAGMLFLVSDNRAMHDDSRDYGLVPRDSCTGRIMFRFWGKDGWSDEQARMSYIR